MPKSDQYYVYVLFDWRGTPRYIGKGRGDRWLNHERTTDPVNLPKNEFIERTWIVLGEVPKVKVREGLTNDEACATEIALIAAIGRADLGAGPLVNMTPGGDGVTGKRRPGFGKRISAIQLAIWAKKTPEERRAIVRKSILSIPIEQQRENGRRVGVTGEGGRASWAKLTQAERSTRAQRVSLAVPVEQRRKNGRVGGTKGGPNRW